MDKWEQALGEGLPKSFFDHAKTFPDSAFETTGSQRLIEFCLSEKKESTGGI